MLWKRVGMILYLCLFGVGVYFAVRIEKYKKKYDIQTYKEIVAFTGGKSLDEIEKANLWYNRNAKAKSDLLKNPIPQRGRK